MFTGVKEHGPVASAPGSGAGYGVLNISEAGMFRAAGVSCYSKKPENVSLGMKGGELGN